MSSHKFFSNIPLVTIDGPSGVGKGTISCRLAQHFGWNYLDSGAIYRIVASQVIARAIEPKNEQQICELANQLQFSFTADGKVWLERQDISSLIRTEQCGMMASTIAALAPLRQLLLQKQHDFCVKPGLVAEGRDMGTVVFPFAKCKIFLDASPESRGLRRYKQLIDKESCASIPSLRESPGLAKIIAALQIRDQQDRSRKTAPLKAATDAVLIDTSDLNVEQVWQKVLSVCQQAGFA